MGELINGEWHAGWGKLAASDSFKRAASTFRDHIAPGDVVAGRYHLYVAEACPWAHRTLITRALRGLEHAIGVTVVAAKMTEDGWGFRPEDPDPIGPAKFLRDVYLRADPRFTGRVTVPVLWDKEAKKIVNNESREVMKILDVELAGLAKAPVIETLYPEKHRAAIESVLDEIYEPINNGVYKAGFARSQEAYEEAVTTLFTALAKWDAVLSHQPYVCGLEMTEADIALFTTCIRFDLVYHGHFKCNVKRMRDHDALWAFVKRMYGHPAIAKTCDFDAIKTHYYWSHEHINPTRIVPAGPADYAASLRL